MAPPIQAPRDLDAGAIALVLLLSALWGGNAVAVKVGVADSPLYQSVVIAGFNFIANMSLLKTYRPSGLAAFNLTTPLFGVLATALVIGEPIGWRLAGSALLVAGGIAVATLLRGSAFGAPAGARRPAAGGIR